MVSNQNIQYILNIYIQSNQKLLGQFGYQVTML